MAASEGGDRIYIDYREISAFAARMKESEPVASKEMRKEVRKLATPIADDVRAAALRLPSKGENLDGDQRWKQKSFTVGLRQGMAQATELKISYSKRGFLARVRISGTKFAAATLKPRKLPRYVEGMGRKPWRHPVYASKGSTNGSWQGAWTEQKATPFMFDTVEKQRAKIREQIMQTFLDAIEKDLTGK